MKEFDSTPQWYPEYAYISIFDGAKADVLAREILQLIESKPECRNFTLRLEHGYYPGDDSYRIHYDRPETEVEFERRKAKWDKDQPKREKAALKAKERAAKMKERELAQKRKLYERLKRQFEGSQ